MPAQQLTADVSDIDRVLEYSPHPTSKFEEFRLAPTPWASDHNTNYAFTRTALVFKDKLDQIRGKNGQTSATIPAKLREQPTVETEELKMSPRSGAPSAPPLNPRIRILRVIQHTLLSITSVAIAVLQSLTYIKWEQTKNVPDAWPQHPVLFPTLLLLAVAVMALLFDASSLIAYLFPTTPLAEKAYHLAVRLHYWITSLKTFAYTIAAAVCRAGFTMGGQQDLWGWSCSAQGQAISAVNDAHVNCAGDTIAWALSLVNISVEIIGVLITQMMENNNRKAAVMKAEGSPNPTRNDSASNPLLSKYMDLEELGDSVQDQLKAPLAVTK